MKKRWLYYSSPGFLPRVSRRIAINLIINTRMYLYQCTLSDDFWAPRIETIRSVTVPFAFHKCEETHRIDNLQ